MKSPIGKWQALAATSRLANLPTVVSNVSLGLVLGHTHVTTASAAAAIAAACALYLAGGFLNDWADRAWDSQYRPERALPAGLFAPGSYLTTALATAALGIATAATTGPHALGIATLIAVFVGIYTWLHKKSAWSVLPMGMCRALLPPLGLAAAGNPEMWPAAWIAGFGLLAHVAGISWLARGESRQQATGGIPLAPWFFGAAAIAIAAGCLFVLKLPPLYCAVALVPYALWTGASVLRRGMHVGSRVAALLAGIPLLDWMILLPLFHATQAPLIALWLPPLAVVTSLLAQRRTPAT